MNPSQSRLPGRRLVGAPLCIALCCALLARCSCEEDLASLPGTVAGVLCDPADGLPLRDHPLEVLHVAGTRTGVTDDRGHYEFMGIPAGDLRVRSVVGGALREFSATLEPAERITLDDDQCASPPAGETGSIAGCFCRVGEGPIAGASVFVMPPSGNLQVTTTDAAGCFRLEAVPAGTHMLEVDRGDFYQSQTVEVPAGGTLTLPPPVGCEQPAPGRGSVSGRVCAPGGTLYLSGATVYIVTAGGERLETETDAEGRYTLTGVPSGTQTLHIEKGAFSVSLEVDVVAEQTLVLPEDDCALETSATIAVVAGQWDDVASVLGHVGVPMSAMTVYDDAWASSLLGDYEVLRRYDLVLFNCGLPQDALTTDPASAAVVRANLRRFVEEGGSVYASDQAYDIVELAFPEFVDFAGNDELIDNAERGVPAPALTATVVDPALASALGTATLELHYPLVAWAVVEAVAPEVRVFIRADATIEQWDFGQPPRTLSQVPHTLGFDAGSGHVIFTSFHQEPGINLQMERVLQLLVFEL